MLSSLSPAYWDLISQSSVIISSPIQFTSLSASALMQFPRASKDLLMLAPSLNRAPLFDVTIARSDPAKSIRDIFPIVKFACNPAVLSFCRTNTW